MNQKKKKDGKAIADAILAVISYSFLSKHTHKLAYTHT